MTETLEECCQSKLTKLVRWIQYLIHYQTASCVLMHFTFENREPWAKTVAGRLTLAVKGGGLKNGFKSEKKGGEIVIKNTGSS